MLRGREMDDVEDSSRSRLQGIEVTGTGEDDGASGTVRRPPMVDEHWCQAPPVRIASGMPSK